MSSWVSDWKLTDKSWPPGHACHRGRLHGGINFTRLHVRVIWMTRSLRQTIQIWYYQPYQSNLLYKYVYSRGDDFHFVKCSINLSVVSRIDLPDYRASDCAGVKNVWLGKADKVFVNVMFYAYFMSAIVKNNVHFFVLIYVYYWITYYTWLDRSNR